MRPHQTTIVFKAKLCVALEDLGMRVVEKLAGEIIKQRPSWLSGRTFFDDLDAGLIVVSDGGVL